MNEDLFDKGFASALAYFAASEAVGRADAPEERDYWEQEAARFGRQITPAAKQAAIPSRRIIIGEARKWLQQHGGTMNISEFIVHFRTLEIDDRYYPALGRSTRLGDSIIRKTIASRLGFKGKAGRPRRKK